MQRGRHAKWGGSYACVIFSADVSPINNQNAATYKIQIREQGAADWTDHALPGISGNYAPTHIPVIFEASPTVSYEIRAGAADDFGEKFSGIRQIPPAALLEVDATGTGMAIGQMAKEPGIFRVNLPTFFNHDVSITGDVEAENVKFGIIKSAVSGDGFRRYVKFADGTLVNWGKNISTQLPITTLQIQALLIYHGFNPGTPDGIMGKKTKAATRAFQERLGLTTDGVPGPVTQKALLEYITIPLCLKSRQRAAKGPPQHRSAEGQAHSGI